MARESLVKAAKDVTTKADADGVPVLHEEDPWTREELAEVRAGLVQDDERLQAELAAAQHDLALLIHESGEGSGDDQADAGAATWEREHEMSLANNARALMEQTTHAIERIDSGGYGVCESCGNAVGKLRLQAFPRATLCMPCKQRQERR
ncbi:MAG: TraR/DksA C4-type zinc finger protein [Ornithinimicrobium sp.]